MPKANKSNFNLYNPLLRKYAVENRNASTKAEACLWKYVLRAGKMKRYSFLCQRPVLNYIADFMCKEIKRIIEIEVLTHSYAQTTEKDAFRQKTLEKTRFKLLRYTDKEVLTALNRA